MPEKDSDPFLAGLTFLDLMKPDGICLDPRLDPRKLLLFAEGFEASHCTAPPLLLLMCRLLEDLLLFLLCIICGDGGSLGEGGKAGDMSPRRGPAGTVGIGAASKSL